MTTTICGNCAKPLSSETTTCPNCSSPNPPAAASPGQGIRANASLPIMPPTVQWVLNGVVVTLLLLNVVIVLVLANTAGIPTTPVASGPASTPTVVSDKNRRFQLTVPSEWSVQTAGPPEASLYVAAMAQDLHVYVFMEEKHSIQALAPKYGELDAYSELLRGMLLKEMTGATQITPTRLMVGGYPAVQGEIKGTINGIDVTFLHTVIETPETFFQVRGLTTTAQYPSARQQLADIAASFRLITNAPSAP